MPRLGAVGIPFVHGGEDVKFSIGYGVQHINWRRYPKGKIGYMHYEVGKMRNAGFLILIAMLCFVSSAIAADIAGTGASLPEPVYKAWSMAYAKLHKENVAYTATGSGDGIKQIIARKVSFGATDVPLSESELSSNKLVQFPTLIGAVVVAYNLPQVPGVKLSDKAIAGIFTGKITRWDDPRIKEENRTILLPSIPITVVVRSDKSGTTYAFSKFLSDIDAGWAQNTGPSMLPVWSPQFTKSPQNGGVAKTISTTPGAIGYIAFNKKNIPLQYAQLQSSKGEFVLPTSASFSAAVNVSNFVTASENSQTKLIRAPAKDAWPILDLTYIVVDASPNKAADIQPVIRFFYWALQNGDSDLVDLGYTPLPSVFQGRLISKIASIKPHDGAVINYIVN